MVAIVVVALAIAELYVFVLAADAFGFWNALGLLIVICLVGVWVVKREGLRVVSRFRQVALAGGSPSREIADGLCILTAGVLLIIPGFNSDAVGILLLLPPVRAVVRPWLVRKFSGSTRVIRATYGGRVYDTTATSPAEAGDVTPGPEDRDVTERRDPPALGE